MIRVRLLLRVRRAHLARPVFAPRSRAIQKVLIISSDAMISALLGTLVEVGGYQPIFAEAGETPLQALQRHGPRVALVDCDRADACEDLFLSQGSAQKTTVVLFSPRRLKDRKSTRLNSSHSLSSRMPSSA